MFSDILGQAPALETLQNALAGDRVHHAYRFEGPAGVGKELTALRFACALLCPQGGCGSCNTCHRVLTFSGEAPHVPLHPDVVLVGRQLYPQSMVSKREASGISVEQIRRIVLGRAGYPPHEGRALLFIVRDAEELTQSAANALLKTLEEPGKNVHFVLLTSRPRRLLDTIRSRTLAVRFRALPEADIATILTQAGKDPSFAALAQGSAATALELSEAEDTDTRQDFLTGVEQALKDPTIASALRFAGGQPSDKAEVRKRLLSYGHALALQVRQSAGQDPVGADVIARRYQSLQRALDALERNTSTTLALEAMLVEMRTHARA